jgi:serine/threonine protein phosphatase PrpC
MGAYLSEPDKAKYSEHSSSNKYHYSASMMQGWRKSQEDAHIAILALPNGEAIFGVFDGHGGDQVSKFVEKKFVEVFTKLPEYRERKYSEALTKCFIQLDEMMSTDKSQDPITAYSMSTGCTSCVALIT